MSIFELSNTKENIHYPWKGHNFRSRMQLALKHLATIVNDIEPPFTGGFLFTHYLQGFFYGFISGVHHFIKSLIAP